MNRKSQKPSEFPVPAAPKLRPKRGYLATISLRRSLSHLQMFRYIDAYGGRAVGGEKLEVTFKYQGVGELVTLLNKLEVQVIQHDQKPVKRVPSNTNNQDTKLVFPTIIRNTHWIENPGHTEVFGEAVFIWCDVDTVSIAIKGGPNGIDHKLVKRVLVLEDRLQSLSSLVIDPAKLSAERVRKRRDAK